MPELTRRLRFCFFGANLTVSYASAYEQVNQVGKPDPEVLQKANRGAREMYDVLKKRELALQKYQAVVATNVNTAPAETARKRMKEAYRQE